MCVAILMQFLKDAQLFTADELHDVLAAFGTPNPAPPSPTTKYSANHFNLSSIYL